MLASGPGTAAEPSSGPMRAVFGMTGLVRFGFGLTLAVFAAYVTGHASGLSTTEVGTVGLVSGLAPIGEFGTVLGSGILADRRGRFPVLAVGMAGAAVALLLISFSRDPWVIGPVNFGFGICSGAILAASLAVVGDRAGLGQRGLEMGRFDAANLVGWVGGFATGYAFLGALPNGDLPWVMRGAAVVLALGLLYAFSAFRRERVGPPTVPLDLRRLFAAIGRRDVLLVTVPWFAIYLLLGTVFVFLGTASGSLGVSPFVLAGAIGGGGLLLVLTQPAYGRLADRYGRTRLMVVGASGFVGLLAGAAYLATYGVSYPVIGGMAVCALAGLAYGPAALAALADLSHRISRATTMAVYTLTISLGMWVGLAVSTGLYTTFGATGLDLFFGGIAAVLGGLTALRVWDVRTGRAQVGV